MIKKKTPKVLFVITSVLMMLILGIGTLMADSTETKALKKNLVITFTAGDKANAFNDVTKTITSNAINGYVELPESFASTVSMNSNSYYEKVDDETFYFNQGDYSYTFTGWKVAGSDTYIPMKTVFQPGEVVDIEKLNVNGNYKVTLEAVWGRVTYVQNEYTGRYYTDYWIYDKATTESKYTKTSAWNYKYENGNLILNKGKNYAEPLTSLDFAYYIKDKSKDANYQNAYLNVIMLTGDLDYIKGSALGSSQANYTANYARYNKTFTDNGDTYSVADSSYDSSKKYVWGDYTAHKNIWGTYYYTNSTTASNGMTTTAWQAMTFKSKGNTPYTIYWNALGYSDCMYGSIRFDNVNLSTPSSSTKRPNKTSPTGMSTETAWNVTKDTYAEFTRRMGGNKGPVLRPGIASTVVVNGGYWGSWQIAWNGIYTPNYDIEWYLGGNARVGQINLGTTETYGTSTSRAIVDKYSLTITGGTVAGNIFGSCNASTRASEGDRYITIIGDKSGNTKYDPKITGKVYGAGQASELIGNTYIDIRSCSNINGVYGGGYLFSASQYGNTNIDIYNSKVNGDVFGGGYNGNVDEDSSGNGGYATINIEDSVITGNVYGVGMGGTQSTSVTVSKQAYNGNTNWKTTQYSPNSGFFDSIKNSDYADYDTDWSWNKPAIGFPSLVTNEKSAQYGYVISNVKKGITWTTNTPDYISFTRAREFYYFSLAFIKNDVKLNISGSTIGTSSNGKGNVYGGGALATIYGSVDIDIKDSLLYGNLYGGGDGKTKPAQITLYEPKSESGYTAPSYTVNSNGTVYTTGTEENGNSLGKFSWSDDVSLLEKGGIDYENKLVYTPNNLSDVGSVQGEIDLNVSDTEVRGDIYGGGNAGKSKSEVNVELNNITAGKNVFGAGNISDVQGNITLTVKGENTIAGSLYGGSNEGTTNGVTANISGTSVAGDIYAGGNKGNVASSTSLKLKNSSAKNIYGGGYSGLVVGNTNVELTDVSATEVFGGGYAGDVRGHTILTVNSGTYTRVFAGCDQAVVKGGTTTTVGSLNNPNITISDVLYGGGRGVDSDGDGNASEFITVEGNSIVNIIGMNTRIENYGSTKLGSVAGIVDVTFNTYRNDNSTKPYVTMNGIDRATNVYLINSYIALENMNENGVKEGIKNIENLYVPDGSGLKVTADSEITGNFNGGGYFYLNSEVTLLIGGDITGKTTLVINPQLLSSSTTNSSLIIKGGIENAYLVVKGSSNAGAIICEDVRYKSRQEYLYTTYDGLTAGYFYLDGDVGIDQQIDSVLNSIEGIHYTENSNKWDDQVIIYQDSMFTTNIDLSYNFLVANLDTGSYRSITRSLVLKESDIKGSIKYFPAGTEITMVVLNEAGVYEYYKYTVSSRSQKIYIENFVNMETDEKYSEVKNLVDDDKTSIEGSTENSTIYARNESFRFVVDFTYCKEYVPKNTYIMYMDIENNNTSLSALSNNAANVIDIRNARNYDVEISTESRNYEEQSIIPTNISINIEASELVGKDRLVGYPLYALVTVKDSQGNYTNLPAGTVVKVNDTSETLDEGAARFEIINRITDNAHSESFIVYIDMSNCEPYMITSGIYTFEYSIYVKDVEPEKTVAKGTYGIMLNRRSDNYSVDNIFFKTLADAVSYIETNNLTTSTIKTELGDSNISPVIIKDGYNITLDLNGKSITGVANTLITNNGTFNVIDGLGKGAINLTGNNSTAYIILNTNTLNILAGKFVTNRATSEKAAIGSTAGTVKIENATFITSNPAIDISAGITDLNITNTQITSKTNALNVTGATATNITLSGSNNFSTTSNCINISSPTDITILDGNYVSTGAIGLKHTSTGSTVLGENDEMLNDESPVIKGTTYGLETNATLKYYDGIIIANNSKPISKEADEMPMYCVTKVKQDANTYKAYLSNIQNCTWNGTYYDTFQDAIDAMKKDNLTQGTIRVERDYIDEKSCIVPADMNITIDTNGKIVSKENSIDVKGTLNIIGNGEITSTYQYTIKNEGILNLTNTKLSNKSQSTSNVTQVILNESDSKFVMNSGNLIHEVKSNSTMGASVVVDNGGTVEILDGKIKLDVTSTITNDVYNAILLQNDSSTLNLKGGTLEATSGTENINAINIKGKAKTYIGINDQILDASNPLIISDGIGVVNGNADGTFVLYDGTIKGKVDAYTGTMTDWAAGYEKFEFVDNDGYDTVFLTSDLIAPTKTVENFDDPSLKYVGAKVTITDNDRVDPDSLKYLWTTRNTGVTEAELTESFTNGQNIYAPFGKTGEYYLWIVAKDTTGNRVFGTDGHCFKLENPQLEVQQKENANGKTEIFVLGFSAENKYKNYEPTANNDGKVSSAESQHPMGTAWQLEKTGTAIQKHSLEGSFENEFSGLKNNTYVIISSDYKTSSAAGETEFESNKLYKAAYAKEYSTQSIVSNLKIVADNKLNHASEVLLLKEDVDSSGVIISSGLPNWQASREKGSMIIDTIQWFTIPSANISDDVAEVKWAYGEKDVLYFSSNGNVVENATSFRAVRDGTYTIYMKTKYGREITRTIEVEGVDTSKLTILEWSIPENKTTTVTLPVSQNVNLIVDWGDGSIDLVTSDNPTHTYDATGTYEVRIVGTADYIGKDIEENDTYCQYLTKVIKWGELNAQEYYFTHCVNLSYVSSETFENTFVNVTSFNSMFENCTSLQEIDLTSWNTEKVVDFSGMFKGCENLQTLNASKLNMSNAKTTNEMFADCKKLLEIDTEKWTAEKLTNISGMFKNCESLARLDLKGFKTSSVTDMSSTFENCSSLLELDVSSFNTSKVTDFSNMFSGCEKIKSLDITNFNTNKAELMTNMFKNCYSLKSIDLLTFNTLNVTNMDGMFSNNMNLQIMNLGEEFNKLIGQDMFYADNNLKVIISMRFANNANELIEIDIEKIGLESTTDLVMYVPDGTTEVYEENTNYTSTFEIKPVLELVGDELIYIDLGVVYDEKNDEGVLVAGFSPQASSNYTQFSYELEVSGLSIDVNTPGVYEVTYSLENKNTSLVLMMITRTIRRVDNNKLMERDTPDYIDGELIWYAIGAKRAEKLEYTAESIKTITLVESPIVPSDALDSWEASFYDGDKQVTAWVKKNAENSEMYDLYIGGNKAIIAPEYSERLFAEYTNCTSILGLELLNTSSVVDMSFAFYNDKKLINLDSDITNISVEKVENMESIFENCESITYINLKEWNTESLNNMTSMFANCKLVSEINLEKLKTDNVESLDYVFYECNHLSKLNVSSWNTKKVTSMESVFYNNSSLKNLELSGWNFENVTITDSMFEGCTSIESIELNMTNSNQLARAKKMFENCTSLQEIDLSTWNTSKLVNADYMFKNCEALKLLDMTSWSTSSLKYMNYMFGNCSNLEVLQLGKNFEMLNGSGLFNGCEKLQVIILEKRITSPDEAVVLGTVTGLDTLPNAIIYVLDKVSETNYEQATNYATYIGAERIKPILELKGENAISIRPADTYKDEGVTVAGMSTDKLDLYTKLGYTLQVSNNVKANTSGRYQVIWTIHKPSTTELMSVAREVYIRYMPTTPKIIVTQNEQEIENGKWANGDLKVTITGSTYVEGEMEYIYSLDGTTWNTGSEFVFDKETLSTTIYAKARGVVEKEDLSPEVSFEIKLDKTVPEIVGYERIRYDDVNEVIKLVVYDGAVSSGVAKYAISSQNDIATATWQNSSEIMIPDNGTWYVWVKDVANNFSESYEITASEKLKVEAQYGTTVEKYVDLNNAINSLRSLGITEATLKLLQDDEVSDDVKIYSDLEYKLDTNGKTIKFTGTSCLDIEGTFTLVNTTVKKGYIIKEETEYSLIQVKGTLIVDGNVQIEAYNNATAIRNNGTTIIKDGIVRATNAEAIYILKNATANLIGGTILSTSTIKATIFNEGTLNIGEENLTVSTVSTDTPRIESSYKVIDNDATLNIYDGRLVSVNKTTILDGTVTALQTGYHLVKTETTSTKEMYLETNDTWIEYWDISETAGIDNVYAGIKIVEGDGITDNTRYKLVVGGTGNAKSFSIEYTDSEIVTEIPWFNKYANTIVELDLEEGVTKYGSYTFYRLVNVKSLTLPESLREIEVYAFAKMRALTGNVNIPKNVYVVRNGNPFYDTNVTSFTVDAENTKFKAIDDTLYNITNNTLIAYPTGRTNATMIAVDGTTSIGERAFTKNQYLKTAKLPNTLTEIDWGAFENTVIEEITIPSSVTSIYGHAFNGCSNLKNVYLKINTLNSSTTGNRFINLAKNSIIYTESKEIADMLEPDVEYTSANTKVYYPYKITSEMQDMVIEYNTTLVIDLQVREGYINDDVVYQWYKDGEAIKGATSAVYTKPSFKDSDKGNYKLVIKSALQGDGTYYYVSESAEGYVSLGDTQPPESLNTSVTYNKDGTATITITAKDNETGVEGITLNGIELDVQKNEGKGSATATFKVDTVGEYVIEARDYAQNKISTTLNAYEIIYYPEEKHQIKINDVDIKIKECEYEKVGYEFVSWNTNEEGTGETYNANALYTGNETLVLYATWNIKEYTVRFYNDNGIDGEQLVSEATYPYGAIIEVPKEQYKTSTEIEDEKYRIYYHNDNWTAVRTNTNSKEKPVNITSSNKDSIKMVDSDVNYYATYSYRDYPITQGTIKIDGNSQITGEEVGIINNEGLVIIGENSTEASKPTIIGTTPIQNNNGILIGDVR